MRFNRLLRGYLTLIFFIVWIPFMYSIALFTLPLKILGNPTKYIVDKLNVFLQYIWSYMIVKILGINIKITYDEGYNEEKLKDIIHNDGVIFVSNHIGTLDPLIINVASPCMSLKTGFKWNLIYEPPFIGILMLLHNHIPIFNENSIVRKIFDINYKEYFNVAGSKLMKKYRKYKNCDCLLIFPEGTRHKPTKDIPVKEFKLGAFHLAKQSKCNIIPICIVGSDNVMRKGNILPNSTDVHIHFGFPIYPADKYSAKELCDNCHNIISQTYENIIKI